MIIVNRIEDLISGSINGNPFSVTYDEQKYKEMLRLQDAVETISTPEELKEIVDEFLPLTEESYKEIVETASPYLFVNKHTNRYYIKFNNTISSVPLPTELVDILLKSLEKKIDITPLIKFWVRFLRTFDRFGAERFAKKAALLIRYINAPYVQYDLVETLMEKGVSMEIAKERATTTQVAITKEGLLVGYKVSHEITRTYVLTEDGETVKTVDMYQKSVDPITGIITYEEPKYAEERIFEPALMKQDGDAFLCIPYGGDESTGTAAHVIRVGHTHVLDNWNKVDTNDGVVNRPGLHVGGLRYISGFQNGEGNITHNVFIDPMDIGAIVGLGEGNDGAMRVRRYFVFGTFEQVNKGIYHSSKIGAMNDAEYAKLVEEAVEKSKMDAIEAQKLLNEKIALR